MKSTLGRWGRGVASGIFFWLTLFPGEASQSGAPHQWTFGALKVDGDERSVVFPAKLNMHEGALEYGIVTKTGPVHESLLVTEINPVELHAAFLLLGVNGQNIPPVGPAERLDGEGLRNAPDLNGQAVGIKLHWKEEGLEKVAPLEDWVGYADGRSLLPGVWLYTGSYLQSSGGFAAQTEGSVLCLVNNPAALLNNPRPGRTDDHVWVVKSGGLPPVGTEVTVEIALVSAPPAAVSK